MADTMKPSEMAAWDYAESLGLEYEGDTNVRDYGGTFFSLADVEHGYVSAVRVDQVPGEPAVWIEPLTILLDDVGSAESDDCLRCIGMAFVFGLAYCFASSISFSFSTPEISEAFSAV